MLKLLATYMIILSCWRCYKIMKHKFRAMTNGEYCEKWLSKHKYCVRSGGTERCPLFPGKACLKENVNEPLVINGKYIMIGR